MKKILVALFLLFVLLGGEPVYAASSREQESFILDYDALDTIFSSKEYMHFALSWSGGMGIGDLYITTTGADDKFVIDVVVSNYGLFRAFYPIDDHFSTVVSGALKLPEYYKVIQNEGYTDKEVKKEYWYDQEKLQVSYSRNSDTPKIFPVSDIVYNEFSAFFVNRAVDFDSKAVNLIPVFVDKKRYQVEVVLLESKGVDTIFGKVATLKIMPKLSFKGLYDKDGDTVFWLTDDECRVPVRIESRLLVGSLRADLIKYENKNCHRYGADMVGKE